MNQIQANLKSFSSHIDTLKSLNKEASADNRPVDIMSAYHSIKAYFWKDYTNLIYLALTTQKTDQQLYKEAINALDKCHFSLLFLCDEMIRGTENTSSLASLIEMKLRALYCYLFYTSLLKRTTYPGTWYLIHQLFNTAYKNGCIVKNSPLEAIYKKCLFISLANPYGLEATSFLELLSCIDKLSVKLQISKSYKPNKLTIFTDAESDCAYFKDKQDSPDEYCVDVSKLCSFLKNIERAERFKYLSKLFNYSCFCGDVAKKMLSEIRGSLVRKYERTGTNVSCQFILSFSKTWDYLSMNRAEAANQQTKGLIINKSNSGFCLEYHGLLSTSLKQGQLVGFNENSPNQDFYLGIVRWVKEVAPNIIQFGIETIALNPKAVESHFWGMGKPATHSFLFQANKNYLLTPLYAFHKPFSLFDNPSIKTPEGFEIGKTRNIGGYKIIELQ